MQDSLVKAVREFDIHFVIFSSIPHDYYFWSIADPEKKDPFKNLQSFVKAEQEVYLRRPFLE